MKSNFEILLDSDALVGLFVEHDAHHAQSTRYFEGFRETYRRIVATSYVIDETATVISRTNHAIARHYLATIEAIKLPIIHIDETLRRRGLTIFNQQTHNRTSVVDCVNVAVMQTYDIPQIYAFDRVYHTDFGLANLVYTDMKHLASA
ncbi:MAG: PIN domain-containing protein [Anaerolineae bacterium]|nr:PIN domain-containing protein [Anaerolineae bacterium]